MSSLHPDAVASSVVQVDSSRVRSGRFKLLLLFLLFTSPVVASYLTYYVFQPAGRTNYGELVEPQKPLASLKFTNVETGAEVELSGLRGRWLMFTALRAGEVASLEQRLYAMRQVRLTTGKDMDRIERALILIGEGDAPSKLLSEHEGLRVYRVAPKLWDARVGEPTDRILVVDPLGNLMMRFPDQANPNKMKKDVSRLLRASRIG